MRTDAPVARIDVRDGRVRGVTLESGEELRADVVVAATHPKITFLDQIDRAELPDDFVAAHRAVEDAQRHGEGQPRGRPAARVHRRSPGFDPEVHGGTIVLAESLDDIEGAFQDAVAGRAAALPVRRHLHPVGVRPDARARGQARRVDVHAVGAARVGRASRTPAELDAYADRVIARVEAVAPGFTDSILHRQVIGPYEMEHEYGLIGGNIFHGELSPDQLFHMRPAPGYADFRTPIAGLYQAGTATHGGGGVTGIPGDERRAPDRS